MSQSVTSSSQHIKPNVQFEKMVHGNQLLKTNVHTEKDLMYNHTAEITEAGHPTWHDEE